MDGHHHLDQAPTSISAVHLDRYREQLSGLDITEAEADAFLQSLWVILQSFIDLGISLSPPDETHADHSLPMIESDHHEKGD